MDANIDGWSGADVSSGKQFISAPGGKWAADQLMKALSEGRPLSTAELRVAATLRKDEWIHLDEALVAEGIIRLKGVADLMAAGLVINVPNAMGKTIFQWESVTDMNPAEVSLGGVDRTENDRVLFALNNLPLPIIHKDFNLNLRTLEASRQRGESLDTTQARIAGRLVMEKLEYMYFNGGPQFGSAPIYGLTTHPDRNIVALGTSWLTATGEQILAKVLEMIGAAQTDRFYGPYWLYVPANFNLFLDADFKANSDKSIRQRLLEVDGLQGIRVVDQLTASNVVLIQATVDVCALVEGEPLQTVQWDTEGGFIVKFKAFSIMVPLVRSDAQGRSGVVHAS